MWKADRPSSAGTEAMTFAELLEPNTVSAAHQVDQGACSHGKGVRWLQMMSGLVGCLMSGLTEHAAWPCWFVSVCSISSRARAYTT